MTPLLSIIVLFFIAYLGRSLYQNYRLTSIWFKNIADSGTIFLIIGVLFGPQLMELLTFEIMDQLNVLIGLVLGWAGFLIGLQAKMGELARFQKGYYLFASLNFIIMSTGSLLFAYMALLWSGYDLRLSHIIVLVIIAASSSSILIGLLKRDRKLRGQLLHLLQFSAAFDNMLSVMALGILLILVNPLLGYELVSLAVIMGSVLFSSLMAYLFYKLSDQVDNDQQYFLVLIGFILVVVGVALNLDVSLLFTSFIFGLVLTNLPIKTKELYRSIANAEKPLYYLMLIFVGASMQPPAAHLIIVLAIFLLIHLFWKYIAGILARYPFPRQERPTPNVGFAHAGLGGVALALALDYHLSSNDVYSQMILVITGSAVLIHSVISPGLWDTVLDK